MQAAVPQQDPDSNIPLSGLVLIREMSRIPEVWTASVIGPTPGTVPQALQSLMQYWVALQESIQTIRQVRTISATRWLHPPVCLLGREGNVPESIPLMSHLLGHTLAVPAMTENQDVTQLLSALTRGDQGAASKLMPVVYDELRRLAASYMRREREDHTLQATALVHEAYLKLVEQRSVNWENRAHFFGIAAQLMRRILVDHARGHLRQKRGGEQMHVPIDEAFVFAEQQADEVLAVDNSLEILAKIDPRQARVVELRFFGGLSVEEAADVLGVSPKTVKREWSVAKAWLTADLKERHGITAAPA